MANDGRLKLATLFSLMVRALRDSEQSENGELAQAMEDLADKDPDFWRLLLRKDQHLAMFFDMLAEAIGAYVSTDPDAQYTCAAAERRADWAQEQAELKADYEAQRDYFLVWANAA